MAAFEIALTVPPKFGFKISKKYFADTAQIASQFNLSMRFGISIIEKMANKILN
jgi:hypothetical protein